MRRSRWSLLVASILLLCSLVLFALWAIRLTKTARSLLEGTAQLQQLAQEDWQDLDVEEVSSVLHRICGDLAVLRREGAPLLWAAPALRALPRWGADAAAAPLLVEMANDLCQAGVTSWDALEPLVTALQDWEGTGGEPPGVLLVRHLAEARPALASAQAALERGIAVYERLDARRLSARLQEMTAHLGRFLPTAHEGLVIAQALPSLLGGEGERTYLILVQNEDELRATGGFITGYGLVTLRDGAIAQLKFANSYEADDYTRPYPPTPEAMARLMGINLWVFRDSNWSPDFPTAAEQAIALFRPPEPVRVDGVIALDQEVLRRLVEVLGPLRVGEDIVSGENVLAYIRAAWAPADGVWTEEEWRRRKDFMGQIARALLEHVETAPDQVDWALLGKVLFGLLEEKHLLLYFPRDEAIGRLLAEHGWDGALRSSPGDFLMVVDSNTGYNKVNPRVEEAIVYHVDLSREQPQARLTLIYTHTAPFTGEPCRPEITVGPEYEALMDRCYWDYVRVYTKGGSRLKGARIARVDPVEILGGQELRVMPWYEPPEHERTVLAAVLVLPRGERRSLDLTYTLPLSILQEQDSRFVYSLLVQKQPGTKGHPLEIAVRLPDGAAEVSCTPFPCPAGNPLVFHTALQRDVELALSFRRQ